MDMKESTCSLRCCTCRPRRCKPTGDAASEDNEYRVEGVARSAHNKIRLQGTDNSMPGGHTTVENSTMQ